MMQQKVAPIMEINQVWNCYQQMALCVYCILSDI